MSADASLFAPVAALPVDPGLKTVGKVVLDEPLIQARNVNVHYRDKHALRDVSIDIGGERPLLRARLYSSNLDFDDLGGLIGVPPDTRAGETASPEQRAEAQAKAASPRVLPDAPYNLEKLRSVDAIVQLKAERVDARRLPIEAIDTRLRLEDGLLRIDPLDVAIAGGRMTGNIRLDARRNPIAPGPRLSGSTPPAKPRSN